MRSKFLIAGIAAAAAMLLSPALSGASTAFESGGDLRFDAAAGETNDLTVSLVGANYILDDPGAAITPLFGCVAVNANRVSCAAAQIDTRVTISLGDMDDQLLLDASIPELPSSASLDGAGGNDIISSLGAYRIRAFGGLGNDALTGGLGGDRLEGDAGDDTAAGNGGNDQFTPGAGIDSMNGGPGSDDFEAGLVPDGADTFIGGSGVDSVSYRDRLGSVTVTLDGAAGDGESGEGDNAGADVENVTGGVAADSLTGNGSDNEIDSGGGNDSISGGGGGDDLSGRDGNDTVAGGPGDDRVSGGDGSDSTTGDDGSDEFIFEFSDGDADQISGGGGFDSYRDFSQFGLKIDLDGTADDGFRDPLEGPAIDNVGADVEDLDTQQSTEDILTGNDSANQIDGGPGNDRISGLGGPDALLGDRGDDFLNGGEGIDTLDGAGGADRLRSRDSSPDEASCGSAADILLADQLDDFTVTCDQSSTGSKIKGSSARLKKGKARLKVSCPAAEGIDCKVKITAMKGKRVLAKGAGKVKSGKVGKIKVKLTKAGKKARSKKLILKAKTVLTDASGAKVTTTVPKLTLKR